MARPLRIQYPGAFYHVISRGNARQKIFFNDEDREKFLDWIKKAIKMHNIVCYAYCLMNNHYHLLIETPDANLATVMRDINGNYTQWFNIKHKRAGHLFQGRYKAFVIEKESYLFKVSKYIVLNPVRARLVKKPSDWRWSSYNATIGADEANGLFVDSLLTAFDKDRVLAQNLYKCFIENNNNEADLYKNVENESILGSKQFVNWIWKFITNGSEENKEYSRIQRIVGRPTLNELFKNIVSKSERNSIIKLARFRCGYSAADIGRHINLSPSAVGRISRDRYNIKKSVARSDPNALN